MDGFNGVEDEYGTDVSTDDTSSSDSGTDAEADEMESTYNADYVYSIDSFIQDSQAAGRIYKYKAPEGDEKIWVFWREDNGQDRIPSPTCTAPGGITKSDPATIQDKIRIALSSKELNSYSGNFFLVQFWAPMEVGDQCFLSTSDQAFALSCMYKGLCDYRRHSETYRFNVDIKENPSLPGRVFRYKWPEYTPHVRYYSIEEHPLLKYAKSGNIRSSLAIPIYEKSSRLCIGVLELVYTFILGIPFEVEFFFLMTRIYGAFEMVGLESTHMFYVSELIENPKIGGNICQEAKEIQRVLEVVGKREELLFAQTWVPWEHEKALDSTCAEDLLFVADDLCYYYNIYDYEFEIKDFRDITLGSPMRKCHGVVGKALLDRKPSFCEDVTKFGISDYPLAHCARDCNLSSCFAIPLLSTYSPSETYYIIEFFLHRPRCKNSGVPTTLLNSILSTMRQELKCLKVASAEEQGEGFPFQVITSYRNDECAPSTMHQTSTLPSVSEVIQRMQAEDPVFRPDELIGEPVLRTDKRNVDGSDQRSIAAAMPMAEGTHASGLEGELKNNNEIPFSREVLQQQFGNKLEDAAKNLGVSRSTLKRVCREHVISRWPSYKRKKGGHSPPNSHAKRYVRTSEKHSVERINKVSSYPGVLPSKGTTAHVVTTSENASFVIINAKCGDDTLRFRFTLTSGLKNLVENVTERLNLDAGTFRLKYRDDKDDLILIACDADVQECINCFRSSGESEVRILVSPTTTQAP